MPDNDQVFSSVGRIDPTFVFTECDIKYPVKAILDDPMRPRHGESFLCVQSLDRADEDPVMDLSFCLDTSSLGRHADQCSDMGPLVPVGHGLCRIESLTASILATTVRHFFGFRL